MITHQLLQLLTSEEDKDKQSAKKLYRKYVHQYHVWRQSGQLGKYTTVDWTFVIRYLVHSKRAEALRLVFQWLDNTDPHVGIEPCRWEAKKGEPFYRITLSCILCHLPEVVSGCFEMLMEHIQACDPIQAWFPTVVDFCRISENNVSHVQCAVQAYGKLCNNPLFPLQCLRMSYRPRDNCGGTVWVHDIPQTLFGQAVITRLLKSGVQAREDCVLACKAVHEYRMAVFTATAVLRMFLSHWRKLFRSQQSKKYLTTSNSFRRLSCVCLRCLQTAGATL